MRRVSGQKLSVSLSFDSGGFFMQKWNTVIQYGIWTAVLGSALFLLAVCRVQAAESSAGSFVHTHSSSCYTQESYQCSRNHYSVQRCHDQQVMHCYSCDAQVVMNMDFDKMYCSEANSYWYENGSTVCSICGTLRANWSSPVGYHTLSRNSLTCGMGEGECVAEVTITGSEDWTNEGLTLSASCEILKGGSAYAVSSYSWQDGKLFVTENGTYTVEAVNAAGQKTSASYTVSCIDRTPPVIQGVDGNTDTMTRSSITVTVQAADQESGLAATAYSADGGNTWTEQSSFTVQEGVSLLLVVRDQAGNTVESTISRSDFPYPPEPSPSPSPTPSSPAPSSSTPSAPSPSSSPASDASQGQETGTGSGAETTTSEADKAVDGEQASGQTEKKASGTHGDAAQTEGSDTAEMQKKVQKTEETGEQQRKGGEQEKAEQKKFLVERMQEAVPRTEQEEGQKQEEGQEQEQTGRKKDEAAEAAYQKRLQSSTEGIAEKGETAEQSGNGGQKADGGWQRAWTAWLSEKGFFIAGILLLLTAAALGIRLLWLHSAVLYCYNGGEEYRRLAVVLLRRRREEFELELPPELLEQRGTPRYRLLLKNRLVKQCGSMDLVLKSEERRARYPLEECVDFVL